MSMRKWKLANKSICIKSLLNVPLSNLEVVQLAHRNLKVVDGKILAMTKFEKYKLY